MRREDRTRLVGDRVGDGVIESAELRHFVDAGIFRLERFPGLVAAVERRDTGDIDVPRLPSVAIVNNRLLENEAGEVAVGLLNLGDFVVLNVDVEGNDLDTGIDRPLGGSLHWLGQAMLNDDAVDAKCDRLIDHVGLERGVLAAVEDAQLDAERGCLVFDAGEIGLEKVAAREIAYQGYLDAARLVERGRQALGTGGHLECRRPDENREQTCQSLCV